jgi:adenylate kinase family enzyme
MEVTIMNYSALDKVLAYLNDGVIDESYIINEKDIYYNKKAFDNGDINLCFIIGHSGSGKSTMANNMANKMTKNNVEKYELDDVVWNSMSYTMDYFKEYGGLIYSFFKGPGKKYYYTPDDVKEGLVKPVDNYEESLITDFIKFAKTYANSHKDKKFVIEGLWIIDFCKPEEFKDYAFYIKGTSVLVSRWRAAKRDSQGAGGKKEQLKDRFKNFFSFTLAKNNVNLEKDVNKFRKYFKKLESVNESKDASELDSDF